MEESWTHLMTFPPLLNMPFLQKLPSKDWMLLLKLIYSAQKTVQSKKSEVEKSQQNLKVMKRCSLVKSVMD